MGVEPAVVQGYQMDPEDPLFQLALSRLRKDRDLKIVWTARDAQTGVAKTTGAGWLALSWNPVFAGELWGAETHATLDVDEYFQLYRTLNPGSVLMLDEAEELDARRSMRTENVEFSHDWMMLRKRQIISILTLPSPSALDSRLQELSDVWINSLKRGEALVHGIKVPDYESGYNIQTPKSHVLKFPDVFDHPEIQKLDKMKDDKIDRGRGDSEEDTGPLPDEHQLDIVREYREMGKTWNWIESDVLEQTDSLSYSREWYRKQLKDDASSEEATA